MNRRAVVPSLTTGSERDLRAKSALAGAVVSKLHDGGVSGTTSRVSVNRGRLKAHPRRYLSRNDGSELDDRFRHAAGRIQGKERAIGLVAQGVRCVDLQLQEATVQGNLIG